jgi:hypothetical protein
MLFMPCDITCVSMPDTVGIGAQNSFCASINDLPIPEQGHPFRLPENWSWQWITANGSLPKRLSYQLRQQYGHAYFPTDFFNFWCSELGRHVAESQRVYMDCGKFEWLRGEFGDPNSCWWGEYNSARLTFLRDQPGYAIRLYRKECEPGEPNKTIDKGYARCWAWNVAEDANAGRRDCFVIFNAYGEQLRLFAHVLSTYYGCSYAPIHINSTTIYVNGHDGDTRNGIVLFPAGASTLFDVFAFDYTVNRAYQDCVIARCAKCDASLYQDDECFECDGMHYCIACTYECGCCGERYPNIEVYAARTYVTLFHNRVQNHWIPQKKLLCPSCERIHTASCTICATRVHLNQFNTASHRCIKCDEECHEHEDAQALPEHTAQEAGEAPETR